MFRLIEQLNFTKFYVVNFKNLQARIPSSYGSIQAGTATTKASKPNIRIIGDLKLFHIKQYLIKVLDEDEFVGF